jgi:hypothetical protein
MDDLLIHVIAVHGGTRSGIFTSATNCYCAGMTVMRM